MNCGGYINQKGESNGNYGYGYGYGGMGMETTTISAERTAAVSVGL